MEFLDFNRFDPPAWSQVSGSTPVRGTIADPFMELANGVAKADITPGLYDPAYEPHSQRPSGAESEGLDVDGATREVAYDEIAKALVQIEFNRKRTDKTAEEA